MYYIISKTADNTGKRPLLETAEHRDDARGRAQVIGGTVKTTIEYELMLEAGKVYKPEPAPVEAAPEPELVGPVRTAPSDEAVATVVAHAAQVASQASAVAAEAAALLGTVTGRSASIMAMAHQIKATRPTRKTIGKQEKADPKRPATDEGVIAQAREHLLAIARPEAKKSKVQIVRDMALWGNKKLQRKDVFGLIKSYPGTDLGIADATISTQFQFARSGKDRQHS